MIIFPQEEHKLYRQADERRTERWLEATVVDK